MLSLMSYFERWKYMRTGFEKETVIVFNEAEKSATIHTFNRKIINYLTKIKDTEPDMIFIRKTEEGEFGFEVPKSWIKVRAKAKRNYSDEQLAKSKERMRELGLKRKSK
jgi:hypothetical protein